MFSNPYGAATEVPQTTFNKADGFFLVYDSANAESVRCLNEYLEGIKEYKSTDTPIVLLGINPETSSYIESAVAIDDLLVEHEIS